MTKARLDQDHFELITIKMGDHEVTYRISDFMLVEIFVNWDREGPFYDHIAPIVSTTTIVMKIDHGRFIRYEGVSSYTLTEFKKKTRHEKLAALVRKHYQN